MDIEMTKACAIAMGLDWEQEEKRRARLDGAWRTHQETEYDPLNNDEQAMALLKHFDLGCDKVGMEWHVWRSGHSGDIANANLNHAICECVSKMVKP